MMLEAMTALLSLPRFCSHRPSRSLITVTCINRPSKPSTMSQDAVVLRYRLGHRIERRSS